jgi:phage-related protein
MPAWLSYWLSMAPAFACLTPRPWDGLFELRSRGRSGIGRALYCFLLGKRIVMVHAFIKKTRETPDKELKLARKRVKELQHG